MKFNFIKQLFNSMNEDLQAQDYLNQVNAVQAEASRTYAEEAEQAYTNPQRSGFTGSNWHTATLNAAPPTYFDLDYASIPHPIDVDGKHDSRGTSVKKEIKTPEIVDWDDVDLRCKAIEATCKAFGTRQVDLQEFSDLLDHFYQYIKSGKKFAI